jgi:hypothetical protein
MECLGDTYISRYERQECKTVSERRHEREIGIILNDIRYIVPSEVGVAPVGS